MSHQAVAVDADSMPTDAQIGVHNYVKSWSDEEWDRWTEWKRELIGGLERGFIALEPPAQSRFTRDPDGGCFQTPA